MLTTEGSLPPLLCVTAGKIRRGNCLTTSAIFSLNNAGSGNEGLLYYSIQSVLVVCFERLTVLNFALILYNTYSVVLKHDYQLVLC